jgi:hypothetical protein
MMRALLLACAGLFLVQQPTPTRAQDCAATDSNGDGAVDVTDLLALLGNFGCSTSGGDSSDWTYLGCFHDNNGARDLQGSAQSVATNPLDAANECAEVCDGQGFRYFGLQWANECFCDNSYRNGYGANGNQGDNGMADISDCDADSTIEDGVADLCSNGQNNCGNRNAVYRIGPGDDIINLDQLDGVSAECGPGVSDRGNANGCNTVIDLIHSPAEWVNSPDGGPAECDADLANSLYMTIDLGGPYLVSGVTIWHYYGNDRAYCSQRAAVSMTGAFEGEEYEIFNTGADYGPSEDPLGNIFTFPPTVAQFVRHWSAGSTSNPYVHFLEIDVYGVGVNPSINLDQLDGVTAIAGPGVNDRGAPEAIIDMDHSPGSWVNSPTADFGDCNTNVYMTIDLGDYYYITGVTIWHYYGNDRAYCSQKIAISASDAFEGEESVAFDTGTDYGPTESEDGNAFTFAAIVGRYVRHWSGRSTSNSGVHFMEIDVYGLRNPAPAPPPPQGEWTYLGCYVDSGDRDVDLDNGDTVASAVASVPLNAANECDATCDGCLLWSAVG